MNAVPSVLSNPVPVDRGDVCAAIQEAASHDVRLRGGPRFVARFDDGALTIAPADSRAVDCHILADPVAFLLVGYGRLSQWGPIARGRLLAWGRKPWLGFKFTSLLKKP